MLPHPCANFSQNSANNTSEREVFSEPDQASVGKSHCHVNTGQTAGCGLDTPDLGDGTYYWDEGHEHLRIAQDLITGCLEGRSRGA